MSRRRQSTKLVTLKNQARRAGWLKYVRKGPGEEADERAMLAGCWFDPRRAQHFLDFAERYGTLTEGAFRGNKFDLTDWQARDASRFFGWQKQSPEWGYSVRRFRYWYEEVPKKNGKTPFASLVGNYLFIADSYGRQINMHTAATTRKQADKLQVHAIRQLKHAPELNRVVDVKKLEGFHEVHYRDNVWNVLAADAASSDGINGHVIADELHRWVGFEFYNTLRWSLASQPEGVFFAITTAGNDLQSVCRTLHDKTKAIDAGRQVDESFYGVIYAADPDDDPHDAKTWHKANPSLGSTKKAPLKLSTFRADYEAAKQDPTQWPIWLQLRLGIWRSGQDSWIDDLGGIQLWDAGQQLRKSTRRKQVDCFEAFTAEQLQGQPCYVGFDGATHHDTTAAVFCFPDPQIDELVRILPLFWLPRAEAEQQQARVPYQQWSEQGLITLTEGDAIDFDRVLADLVGWFARFDVQRFYFDPLFQAEWLTQKLEAQTGVPRVEFPQRITHFAPVMAAAERLILNKKLRHNGHPILTWQIGHVQTYTDVNNNKRPVKRKANDYKTVDGVVAMLMSLRDAIAYEDNSDYYESNEVEWI